LVNRDMPLHAEWRMSLSLEATGYLNFTDITSASIDYTLTRYCPWSDRKREEI